jgi:hypothetical protein
VATGETVKSLVFDFSVKFNPKITTLKTFTTQSIFDTAACPSSKTSIIDVSNDYVLTTGITNQIASSMMNNVAGVALNGVLILSSSSNQHDPYFPKTWSTYTAPSTIEATDACFGKTTKTTAGSVPIYTVDGVYHYKMLSPCIVNSINLKTAETCASVADCGGTGEKMQTYTLSTYNNYKNELILGIARDGHLILGPYTEEGLMFDCR